MVGVVSGAESVDVWVESLGSSARVTFHTTVRSRENNQHREVTHCAKDAHSWVNGCPDPESENKATVTF